MRECGNSDIDRLTTPFSDDSPGIVQEVDVEGEISCITAEEETAVARFEQMTTVLSLLGELYQRICGHAPASAEVSSPCDGEKVMIFCSRLMHSVSESTTFRRHLEGKLTQLLQGHLSVPTRVLIDRVIRHLDATLRTEYPDWEQHLLLALKEDTTWALWQSCCAMSSWYVKHAPPGNHHSTFGTLETNGTVYFPPPHYEDVQYLLNIIRSGLSEGIRQHRLVGQILRHQHLHGTDSSHDIV